MDESSRRNWCLSSYEKHAISWKRSKYGTIINRVFVERQFQPKRDCRDTCQGREVTRSRWILFVLLTTLYGESHWRLAPVLICNSSWLVMNERKVGEMRFRHTLGRFMAALWPTKRPIGWISKALLMVCPLMQYHDDQIFGFSAPWNGRYLRKNVC